MVSEIGYSRPLRDSYIGMESMTLKVECGSSENLFLKIHVLDQLTIECRFLKNLRLEQEDIWGRNRQ